MDQYENVNAMFHPGLYDETEYTAVRKRIQHRECAQSL